MHLVIDFHIHSKYSRATSKALDLRALDEAARIKGVDILGTGDFTHPLWFAELEKNLEEAEPGLYKVKKSKTNTPFGFNALYIAFIVSESSFSFSKYPKLVNKFNT